MRGPRAGCVGGIKGLKAAIRLGHRLNVLSIAGSVLGRQPVPMGNRWYYG
jgi:hypothetical protein